MSSILDTLTPRTVKVTGARLVKLGLSEASHGRYAALPPEQKKANHREKMRRWREERNARRINENGIAMSSNTLRLLNNYRAGLPINGNALRVLREKGLI